MKNKKKITKEEALASNSNLMMYMVENNSHTYNMNKCIEECVEFSEVIIKLQTKSDDDPKKPKKEKSVSEFSDLIIRGYIALLTLFPDLTFDEIFKDVSKQSEVKFEKIKEYLKSGKYKNGL